MALSLLGVHHIALICTDYTASKRFYTEVLGLKILAETYRAERESYKLDLALGGQYLIELFSFPSPPPRASRPAAAGCATWPSPCPMWQRPASTWPATAWPASPSGWMS